MSHYLNLSPRAVIFPYKFMQVSSSNLQELFEGLLYQEVKPTPYSITMDGLTTWTFREMNYFSPELLTPHVTSSRRDSFLLLPELNYKGIIKSSDECYFDSRVFSCALSYHSPIAPTIITN